MSAARSRILLFALSIVWGAASCDLTGPEWITRPGYLESYSSPPLVQLPDEAGRGETIAVVVETYGSGCTSASETLVEYPEPMVVSITPIDRYPGSGFRGACPAWVFTVRHVANVSFHGLGEAEVLIRGRRFSNEGEEELVLEREITITSN